MSRVLKNFRITQSYKKGVHNGVDLGREKTNGEPVFAHSNGKVVALATGKKNDTKTTGTATYGNYVKIDHENGYCTLYAHLATVIVKNGQRVKKGDKIGTMGNTGNSYGVHLHFEVRKGTNERIDPTPYLTADLPTAKTKNYFKKYTGTSVSIVDALKAVGATTNFAYRLKIAKANGIKAYIGTAAQNKKMVELIKAGKLIKP